MLLSLLLQPLTSRIMFDSYPGNSKVWIYTSNREINVNEQVAIQSELDQFMKEWAAHGNSLFGEAKILEDRFVVLVVDESMVSASGCSIDTSVNFMKSIGQKFDIDFFDRLNMTIESDGEKKRVHISELKDHEDAFVYNPMITSLSELRTNWKVKVSESPFV